MLATTMTRTGSIACAMTIALLSVALPTNAQLTEGFDNVGALMRAAPPETPVGMHSRASGAAHARQHKEESFWKKLGLLRQGLLIW